MSVFIISNKENKLYENYLNLAHKYAVEHTGCTKVAVGSVIVNHETDTVAGANRAIPNLCKTTGCLRVQKYGNNDKTHRGGADCRAIHSEIDAIAKCSKFGVTLGVDSTIYITRYPCESCARAIVAAGIKRVVFGRKQCISEMTQDIFMSGGVEVVWYQLFESYDVLN